MGASAVCFQPELGSARGAIRGHDHAAAGGAGVVHVGVCLVDVAVVAMLMTVEGGFDFPWCQQSFGAGRDQHLAEGKERGCFHTVSSLTAAGRWSRCGRVR